MLVNLSDVMTVQFGSLYRFGQKNTAVKIYFKNIFFLVWVPNSEKKNPRKSYLNVLVRIAELLYSEDNASVSVSASAYVRSGSASNSASGSESTVSPIYLN
jgi:hypothetical protein